jgi:hypothetical protein
MLISEIVQKHTMEKAASAPADLVKTAKDAGVEDGDKLVKLATHIGELIGTTAGNRATAMINEAFAKMAGEAMVDNHSAVGGTNPAGTGQAAAAISANDQVAQLAVHHAELAVTAAKDAADALSRDDEHTATMQFSTAAKSLETAKLLASQCNDAVASAKVSEAASAVGAHASAAGA